MGTPGIVIEVQQLRMDNEVLRKEVIRYKQREVKLYAIILFTKKFLVAKDVKQQFENLMEELNS